MESTLLEITAIVTGLVTRIGLPIALTVLLALFLKRLDKRWQAEAKVDASQQAASLKVPMAERPHCWEIYKCPPALRDKCVAYTHPDTPCWELYRTSGHYNPACRSCKCAPPEVADKLVLT